MDGVPKGFEAQALRLDVEDFLHAEADLVDDRKFDQWLALFSEDLQYRMPIVRNIAAPSIANEYLSGPLDVSWFDEGKETLATRVAQIQTGVHWAEEPLSRVCHFVTNIRLAAARPSVAEASEVEIGSRFIVYQNRVETETYLFAGRRNDLLRRDNGKWLLVRREILLDQNVLLAKNLSVFF